MAIKLASYWIILFVLSLTCAKSTDVCNETYLNKKGLQCFPCRPGYTKKGECRTNQTHAQCIECNEGTYQPHCISANETGECRNCRLCAVYIQHCTIYQNAVCGGSYSTDDTSEEKGHTLHALVFVTFSVIIIIIITIIIALWYWKLQLRGHVSNNKRNSDEFINRKMLRGDTNHDGRRKDEYIRTCTATESEASRLLESIESTEGKVSTIEYIFGENDKKQDSQRPKQKSVNVHVDGGSKDTCTTDESQIFKTKDVSEEKIKNLSKRSKHIAVISPVKGTGVNSNRYGGLQLTRERLQFSGDSENTPKENTNNKRPANNGTPLSHAENQIVHLNETAGSEAKDISREQCGLPKDVDNEKNKIKHNNKRLDLAYFELLKTWYSMMGSEASLEHIESALKRLDNNIIMEEFERIKDNPPTRKIFAQNTDTSLMPWRQNEQFPLTQRQLFAFAQHESTHEIAETHGLLSHRGDGHVVQLTNFSAASQTQTSQTFLPDPSRLALQQVQQRSKEQYYNNNAYHKVRRRGSKVKKKKSRRRSELKKKLKLADKIRKMEAKISFFKQETITLIKTILPLDKIPLSRQQYSTFLDYTVNVIMEHNHVSRKTVLSVTYESYTEIAETKNGGRYILYSGSPNLKLDKEQYDCLVFYVKFARTRVLKEIEELQDNGDTLFLFITYDGKSALEEYQKQSHLKKRTNMLNPFESDRSSSETESSDGNDMKTGEGLRSQIRTSSAYSTMYDHSFNNDVRVETYHLPAISENNKSLNNEHTVSIQQNNPNSKTINDKQEHNAETDENHDCNDNEVITVVKGFPESRCFKVENEMSAECIPVEENRNHEVLQSFRMHNRYIANHNNGGQENDSDMSFEDLMRDIDTELECTTSV